MTTFWSLVLDPGKKYSSIVENGFHLSSAVLDARTVKNDKDIYPVFVKTDQYEEVLLCNLSKLQCLQVSLDLLFVSGTEICFWTSGGAKIHLSGYTIEDEDEDDDEFSSDDEEEEYELPRGKLNKKDAAGSKLSAGAKRSLQYDEEKVSKIKGKKEQQPPKKKAKLQEEEEEDEDDDDEVLEFDSDVDEEQETDEEEEEEDDESEEGEEEEEDKMKTKHQKKQTNQQQQKENGGKQSKQENKTSNGVVSPSETKKDKKKKKKKQLKTKMEQSEQPAPKQEQPTAKKEQTSGGKQQLEGGVLTNDLKVGSGVEAKPGRMVSVYYTGRLKQNGKVFDQTNSGPGFKFRLGKGEVIKGWEIGLAGMKVGGKRKLTIPPQMAYGSKGAPPDIPPNSTLIFDVELKSVN